MAQNASFHARHLLALVSMWSAALALTACEPEEAEVRPICGAVTCDLREDSCQELVLDVLQCLRGGDEELPDIDVISEEDYRAIDPGSPALSDEEALRRERFERGMALLKLSAYGSDAGEDDLDEDGGVDDVAGDGGVDAGEEDIAPRVAARYIRAEERIVVVDHDEPSDSPEAFSILAHELVHAFQDREHDLDDLTEGAKSFDEKLARRAVIEGEATQFDVLTFAALQGYPPSTIDWYSLYVSWQLGEVEKTYDDAEPLHTAISRYAAPFGGYFVTSQWLPSGQTAIDELFASPPRSSLEVLAVGTLFDDEAERADALQDELVPVPPAGFELVAYDQLGVLILDVFLHHFDLTSSPNVERDVVDMIADGVSVFYDGQRTVVAWRLRYALDQGLRASEITEWRSALDAPDSDEPEPGDDVRARVVSADEDDVIIIVSDAPLDAEWLTNDLEWQSPPPGAKTPGY